MLAILISVPRTTMRPLLAIFCIVAFSGVVAVVLLRPTAINWLSCHVSVDSILEVGPRLSWAVAREGAWRRQPRTAREHPDCQ
jgi:hypothetical protein